MGGRSRKAAMGAAWRAASPALVAMAIFAWLTAPARAQQVDCSTLNPNPVPPTTTCTVSTTHHETDTPVATPGIVVPGNGPLQVQLNQVLAGPNGAAVASALATLEVVTANSGGGSTKVFLGTSTTVTNSQTFGPGTVLVGSDQSQTFFVAAGNIDINQNTAFESFFELLTASQSLTQRGVNWLSGDLTPRCRRHCSMMASALSTCC